MKPTLPYLRREGIVKVRRKKERKTCMFRMYGWLLYAKPSVRKEARQRKNYSFRVKRSMYVNNIYESPNLFVLAVTGRRNMNCRRTYVTL